MDVYRILNRGEKISFAQVVKRPAIPFTFVMYEAEKRKKQRNQTAALQIISRKTIEERTSLAYRGFCKLRASSGIFDVIQASRVHTQKMNNGCHLSGERATAFRKSFIPTPTSKQVDEKKTGIQDDKRH